MRRLCTVFLLLFILTPLSLPRIAGAQTVEVAVVPPELPYYEQPPLPAPGYIWTPGYWAYGQDGYFWVPGTWALPPEAGLLWTPGYWSWRDDGVYVWNEGYWAPEIGFYGGVYYGYGYDGVGYDGGYWDHGVFAYNRAVNNFGDLPIAAFYDRPVPVASHITRASFNGGHGGLSARPTPQQLAIAHAAHIAATALQVQHVRTASTNRALLATVNRGMPAIAATPRPGDFSGRGVMAARESMPPARGRPDGMPMPGEPQQRHHGEQGGQPQPGAPHQERQERATITPAPAPGTPHPERATITPAPVPPAPPHRERPEKATITPAPVPPAPPRQDRPERATIKPAPTPPPAPPRPAAAPPQPPHPPAQPAQRPAAPACPPGRTLTQVNGHPACK